MHWYKRNLGDYAKKAGRLSMLQHGAYTLLIDACYDREKFPTLEDAIEWAWASTEAEIEAVKFVLSKFFTLENGVYLQNRIQEEIEIYHENAATNKRIAIERETKRKENITVRDSSVNEPPPNHKPLTNNHKPDKQHSSSSDDSVKSIYTPAFESFWILYPRKENKGKAFQAFKKIKPAEYPMVRDGLERKKKSTSWLKDNGQFIPHASSWINARGWEDEEIGNQSEPKTVQDFIRARL